MCISSIQCHWYYSTSDDIGDAEKVGTGKVLAISPAQLTHNGYYFCIGEDVDTKKNFVAMGQMKVYGTFICIFTYKNLTPTF